MGRENREFSLVLRALITRARCENTLFLNIYHNKMLLDALKINTVMTGIILRAVVSEIDV